MTSTAASTAAMPFYVVVEKILAGHEELDRAWPAHGTTGYEFIRDVAGLFVDRAAEQKFTRLYVAFTGERTAFADVIYAEKRLVLEETFANAVTQLGHQLAQLVAADRRWRDLTRHELTVAIREIMAGLGVYRIYRRMNAECRPEDEHEIVLHEEQVVVDKTTVAKERVRLDKDTVTEEQQVTEGVRKEQIEIDDDDSARR